LFEASMKDQVDGFDCKDKLADAYAKYRTDIVDISIHLSSHVDKGVIDRIDNRVKAVDDLVNRLDEDGAGQHVNIRAMNWVICYFCELVKEVKTKLKKFCLDHTVKPPSDKPEIALVIKKEAFVFLCYLEEFREGLELAQQMPADDLFSQSVDSAAWKRIIDCTCVMYPEEKKTVIKDMDNFGSKIMMLMASIGKQHKYVPKDCQQMDRLLREYCGGNMPVSFCKEKPAAAQRAMQPAGLNLEPRMEEISEKNDIEDEEAYRETEISDIYERDKKVNANLESFKNIMTLKAVGSFLKYLVDKDKAYLDAQIFLNNRDPKLIQDIFNMADSTFVKKLRGLTLDGCEHVIKFYLAPSLFHDQFILRKKKPIKFKPNLGSSIPVDLDELLPDGLFKENKVYIMVRMLLDKKLSKFEKKIDKYNELCQKLSKVQKSKSMSPQHNSGQTGSDEPFKIRPTKSSLSEKDAVAEELAFEQNPDSIGQSDLLDSQLDGSKASASKLYSGPTRKLVADKSMAIPEMQAIMKDWITDDEKKYFEQIIIHIHGGGFIGTSSSCHQVYLRKWAKKLGIPIFTIEYRLAPQTTFPFLVNDCIRSYVWILTYLEQILGCNVKKIIIAGDSAGGNLSLGISLWCLENGFRKPDIVHAHYPATSLDRYQFGPALMYSMKDYFLHYNSMKSMLGMYIPQYINPKTNYYLSPMYAPDELLEKLPPVEMYLCERDPLRDNGFRFADQLISLKVPVKIFYFKYSAHGILNMAMPGGIDAGKFISNTIRDSMAAIISNN